MVVAMVVVVAFVVAVVVLAVVVMRAGWKNDCACCRCGGCGVRYVKSGCVVVVAAACRMQERLWWLKL